MKVAVITGAASGIGAGLAKQAVARGMKVVLADRDQAGLDKVAGELGDQALAVVTDVTSQASLDALADKAYAALGQVDLLFNNAGVLSTGNCWEISDAQWQQAWQVNVNGIVNGLRFCTATAQGQPACAHHQHRIRGRLSAQPADGALLRHQVCRGGPDGRSGQ